MHFNITPPTLITTSANNKSNVSTSELSFVINKVDSIEEKAGEIEESTESLPGQRKQTKDSGDEKEEVFAVLVTDCERKASIAERQKSSDKHEITVDVPPPPLPTSISTQTIPTDEFPETIIHQDVNKMESTSATHSELKLGESHQQTAPEIDRKAKGIKKTKSRSTEDKKALCCGKISVEEDEERKHKCYKLTHQQSQVSQDEDLEITMSELVPGCVGNCWISNFLNE